MRAERSTSISGARLADTELRQLAALFRSPQVNFGCVIGTGGGAGGGECGGNDDLKMVANKELNLAVCGGGGGEARMQAYPIRTLASALNWSIGAQVG
jgi:hypothetical protein